MNKSKKIVGSLILTSYLVNPAINVFAEELKEADINNLENEVQKKILPNTKAQNTLQYVYLDGSAKPTENENLGTKENPTNSLEKALELVEEKGTIYVSGEVNVSEDIEMPEKLMFIKQQDGKDQAKLKFAKKLYLNDYLDIKDVDMEFVSNDKDCIFLNGNSLMIHNSEIIGQPNVFLGEENSDVNINGNEASYSTGAFYVNNKELSENAIGNINLGGKNGHTLNGAVVELEGVNVEGTIDGKML